MRRDDELDALRRVWGELEGPDPERALDEPDRATRAALEWMRGAWARVEPPPVVVPELAARRARRVPRWIPLAAAAGIGALLAWAALAGEERGPARSDPARDATVAQAPDAPAPAADRSEGAAVADRPERVEVAAVSRDRMELRSGSVRLILLTENTGPAGARAEDG